MAERKYVVFRIGAEEFGIDIMKVKEITEAKHAVKVPECPDFIEGIINLRGDVIPIVNLKRKFLIGEAPDSHTHSRIIILNLEEKMIGFMVDEASQVVSINDSDVEPPPPVAVGTDRVYMEGIGKISEKMIIILDLLKVLNEDEKKELIDMKVE